MLQNRDIVCMAAVDWHAIRNRSQQLMTRFSDHNRVLYVNPPVSWLAPLRNPDMKNKRRAWQNGPTHIDKGLYVVDVPMVHPFGSRLPRINAINQQILVKTLRPVTASLGFENFILWTYLHTTADLMGKLGEKMLIYDCVDDHGAFPGHDPTVVSALENRLIQRADIVFASARNLYERCKKKNEEVYLIPNGADLTHFEKAFTIDGEAPKDIRDLPKPIVGYIGYIHDWVNLKWLQQTAKNRPDWSFVIIGPVHTDIRTLQNLSNVHFLGEKKYEDLPAYLHCFSVCVIPFHRNTLTRSVNPIKLYEYLAAGKPVVASRLPELESFADVITLVDDAEGFERALDMEIQNINNEEESLRRRQRVKDQSWDHRFHEMETLIEGRKE